MPNLHQSNKNTLAKLAIGESAIVTSVEGNSSISKRLMEMGIVPGVSVKLVKSAPLGCPLQISVRGYHLAIRRSEAENIGINK
ncbi:MAG: ferrous iron transport protein A [Acidobacteriota bacterium]